MLVTPQGNRRNQRQALVACRVDGYGTLGLPYPTCCMAERSHLPCRCRMKVQSSVVSVGV
jgi:hypothetical protein